MGSSPKRRSVVALAAALVAAVVPCTTFAADSPAGCLFDDAHFHLTNYVQKGTDMRKYVEEIMGDKVCR